jgi:hypothetical protein
MSEKISSDDVTRFIKQKLGITVAKHYDKSLIIVVIYRFLFRFSKNRILPLTRRATHPLFAPHAFARC